MSREPDSGPALLRLHGRLLSCLEIRGDCCEWEVEVDGRVERAVGYVSLCGPLAAGDRVLLNGTAVALGLGTGGRHFVIAREGDPAGSLPAFPGREAGHIMKLRYTPLQRRVLAIEEAASPHREAILTAAGLDRMPVLAAELHSQAGAAILAARAARPGLRIAFVMTDTAALPLSLSRLVHRLRSDGILDVTITAGQAFGGDLEAVNVHTALLAARAVSGADLAVVAQGPGNVGTGTEYGFGGLGLLEALHAADALGGTSILAPRLSAADPRPRHRGLSHHTRTLLRLLRVPVLVPVPPEARSLLEPLPSGYCVHGIEEYDPGPAENWIGEYGDQLTSMGRGPGADPLFYRSAGAAGVAGAVAAAASPASSG